MLFRVGERRRDDGVSLVYSSATWLLVVATGAAGYLQEEA